MAKFLEEELKSRDTKHCETCQCVNKDLTVLADLQKTYSVATQTISQCDDQNPLCVKCSSLLDSPSRSESPYLIKLVKSSDSVISETKSSVSVADSTAQNDKLFTPTKKEDLMVNPILGHHRLCDRTNLIGQQTPMSSTTNMTRTTSIEQSLNNPIMLNNIPTPKCMTPQISKPNPIPIEPELINHESNSLSSLSKYNPSVKKTPESSTNPVKIDKTALEEKPNVIAEPVVECNNKGPSSTSKTPGSITSMTHGPGNGSTNSLWSRTSSKEGAKLFENFNRNLIKTIKVRI